MIELRIHGRGGQGVVTMAELLGKAALSAGLEAQALPFFGVERRGAAVKACVRFSDEPVLIRSMSYKPDVIALMNVNMLPYARQEGFAEGDAVIVVNGKGPADAAGPQWVVDAEGIARKHGLVFGGEAYVNVPMFGAIARVLGLPLPDVERSIREQWQGKAASPNLAAAAEAYGSIENVAGGDPAVFVLSPAILTPGAAVVGDHGAEAPPGVNGTAAVDETKGSLAPVKIRQPLSWPQEGAGGLTGLWRGQRPILDKAKCSGCFLCWIYCPEAAIAREDRSVDYDYCKGCGVCARECPAKAIEMVREGVGDNDETD